jgi:predicted RNA-binding protein with PUA-like domain
VRNHAAKNNLQAMRVGDEAFFYHSNEGRAILGVVQVIREYYLDPTDETGQFGMVDVKAMRARSHPVGLDQIKAEPSLKGMRLATHSRLSVQPVTDEEWRTVCRMGGLPDAS